MTEFVYNTLIPIILTTIASSGFWMWLASKQSKKTMQSELLVGLAHDRLSTLSLIYITRGWITQDEYENINDYLYKPYLALGGNGSVKRLMLEIDKLPIRKDKFLDKLGETIP